MFVASLIALLLWLPTPEQATLLNVFRKEFIKITPGKGKFPRSFQAGGQAPGGGAVRTVKMEHDFEIAKFEVPQNLWQAVMDENPSRWRGRRNSVEQLSFDDAQEFCKRATKLMREAKLISPDEEIRLPTETEWEYAARAGTKTRYSFGDDRNELNKYAWSTQNAAGNDPEVGALKPNPWGLYDVHG